MTMPINIGVLKDCPLTMCLLFKVELLCLARKKPETRKPTSMEKFSIQIRSILILLSGLFDI